MTGARKPSLGRDMGSSLSRMEGFVILFCKMRVRREAGPHLRPESLGGIGVEVTDGYISCHFRGAPETLEI